jgi:hypothetical protein
MKLAWLLLIPAVLAAEVRFIPEAGRIRVEIGGKPVTAFYYGGELPKPFLYPLETPSGVEVTRGYPPSREKGDALDHPHHRGLWFATDDVNGENFWNESKGKHGFQVVRGEPETKGGRKQGTLKAVIDWKQRDGTVAVTEERVFTFHDDPRFRIIDVDITLAARQAVKFGDTKEGTLGVRLNSSLQEEKGTGVMTNAEGLRTEKEVWGKASAWVDYSGTADGKKAGITIMDHPANPGHPNRWHARAYGLFALNVFGLSDFVRDKTRVGGRSLDPGANLRYRFRVIVHDGELPTTEIPTLYHRWTKEVR